MLIENPSGFIGRIGSNRISVPVNGTVAPSPLVDSPIATLPPNCSDKLKRALGNLDLQFFTIQTAGTNAQADVPVTLPNYCRFIMVNSCPNAHLADSLYLHFDKLNKTYTTATITPTGQENWLPLSQQVSNLSKIGLFYRFKNYLPPIVYFDIGQEGGAAAYQITFMTGNDLEKLGSMFATVA